MIRIENVKKDYVMGDILVHALKGVSLSINSGEFLSIAGPSGSGKTTLLNILGCIDNADEGDIIIEDKIIVGKTRKELAALRREKIGFIFQSFNLIPVLSAYENVAFTLSLLKASEEETHRKTMAILDEVGLKGMESRRPGELSGGQQQRVAIARALVKSPSLVLADEPTANLDSDTGKNILELMEELNRRHGTTFIFSTHDSMVMDFAHRLIMLHDGLLTSDNPTERALAGRIHA